MLSAKKGAIQSRLPAHLSADRMVKIAITAAIKNPKILQCQPETVMMSIMQAAELGLEPGGALGEGYLVPYGATCQFIPGYRGLINLARRSGQILTIEAHEVRANDKFEAEFGLDPRLIHSPLIVGDRGDVIAFYAVAILKDTPRPQYDVMTKAEVDAIRARSKASGSGPWVTDYNEMGKKTVIRRLAKMLPLSVELASALELQANTEMGSFDPSLEVVMEDAQREGDVAERAAAAAASRGSEGVKA